MTNLNLNVTTTRDEVAAGAKQAAAALDGPVDAGALAKAIVGVAGSFPPGEPGDAVTISLALNESSTSTQCSVAVTVAKPEPKPPTDG